MKEELNQEEKQAVIDTYDKLKAAQPQLKDHLKVDDLLESARIDKFYKKTQVENGIEFTHISTGKSFNIYKEDYDNIELNKISPYVNGQVRIFEKSVLYENHMQKQIDAAQKRYKERILEVTNNIKNEKDIEKATEILSKFTSDYAREYKIGLHTYW